MEERKKIFCYPGKMSRYLSLPCQVSEFGYLPDQLIWNVNRTLHALYFCIILNSEGGSRGLVNGQIAKAKFPLPCLHIHPPGTVLHTLKAVKHDEIFFCYTGENAQYMMNMGFENTHFEITPEINDIISRIHKELLLPDTPAKADTLDLLALQFLVAIRSSKEMLTEKYREDGTRFPELVSYLELHFKEELSLPFLLQKFGFSRRTFFRLWKKKYSCSFTEYVNDLKLAHAEKLLTSTSLSIEEIARQSAFASSTYFIRRFKRKFFLTPELYRKRKKERSFL